MSGELLSLRLLAICAVDANRDLLRQGAALALMPWEVIEVDNADRASAYLDGGDFDLVVLDSPLSQVDQIRVVRAARTGPKPPFVVLLVDHAVAAENADLRCGDAAAVKPRSVEEARRFMDRCGRSRLPNRVLIVDDSATMRSIVRKILAASRFPLKISEVSEGAAALSKVRECNIDVVFLDYNMPGLDGVATLAELKQCKSNIDVIIMTSAQDAVVAARAKAAGASAFLRKPFYPADVDVLLHSLYGLVPLKSAGNLL